MSSDQLGSNFVLTNDITLSNHTPIGPFTGKFYGNGHTITINGINAADNMGLFGVVNGAEIRDLHVVYGNSTINGGQRFGGITGYADGKNTVKNVIVDGTIMLEDAGTGDLWIGGVCGYSKGYDTSYTVFTNCTSRGASITAGITGTVENLAVGGFAGQAVYTQFDNCSSQSRRSLVNLSACAVSQSG